MSILGVLFWVKGVISVFFMGSIGGFFCVAWILPFLIYLLTVENMVENHMFS